MCYHQLLVISLMQDELESAQKNVDKGSLNREMATALIQDVKGKMGELDSHFEKQLQPDNQETQSFEKETKSQIIAKKLAMITKGANSLVQMIPQVQKAETNLGMIIDDD